MGQAMESSTPTKLAAMLMAEIVKHGRHDGKDEPEGTAQPLEACQCILSGREP